LAAILTHQEPDYRTTAPLRNRWAEEERMNKPERSTCPDCNGALSDIKIVDMSSGAHMELKYAAGDARKEFPWFAQYPTKGTLRGKLCEDCGRVLLYAVPKE
jgi:uncharacterized OB-fold protein